MSHKIRFFYILFNMRLIIMANCNIQNFLWVEMIRILSYTMWQAVPLLQRPESEFPWREIIFLLSAEQLLCKCSDSRSLESCFLMNYFIYLSDVIYEPSWFLLCDKLGRNLLKLLYNAYIIKLFVTIFLSIWFERCWYWF